MKIIKQCPTEVVSDFAIHGIMHPSHELVLENVSRSLVGHGIPCGELHRIEPILKMESGRLHRQLEKAIGVASQTIQFAEELE
jgi:hypothetical protein